MLVSCLAFQAVDGQVVGTGVIPITWPSYTLGRVTDEQTTTVCRPNRAKVRPAGGVGDQHAVLTLTDAATLMRTVMVEGVIQQNGTRGHGQELGLEADQATARDDEVQTDATPPSGVMLVISPLRRPSCSITEP